MQTRRNLFKFSLQVDKNRRLDAPALKRATHSPEALASLFLHGIDCCREHALVVVVELGKDVLCFCLCTMAVCCTLKTNMFLSVLYFIKV